MLSDSKREQVLGGGIAYATCPAIEVFRQHGDRVRALVAALGQIDKYSTLYYDIKSPLFARSVGREVVSAAQLGR